MGNSCCRPNPLDSNLFEEDKREQKLEKNYSAPIPGFLDVHEQNNMSVGIPSPDLNSPIGKFSMGKPSERSMQGSLKTITGAQSSTLVSIAAYDSIDSDYPLPPPKEFWAKVQENILHTFKRNQEFKFRLNEYPGSGNPVEFRKDGTDGKVYFGQCKKLPDSSFIMEGRGYVCIKDSQLYVGYLVNDLPEGPGVMIYRDNSYFKGVWKSGALNGFGLYISSDGSTYKGNWVNNLQEGYGVETWNEGKNTYSGYFKRGKRWGQGSLELKDEGTSYKGDFENHLISGKGLFLWADGKSYDGQWKNDQMHGQGIFKWPDGRIYKGEYKNGKKEGYGEFFWPDGKRFEGYWRRGLQNGQGTFIDVDGSKKTGFWINGVKSETATFTPSTSGLTK